MAERQTAVITGASSGIGRAAAHAFAKAGYDIALVARREDELEAAAKECKEYGAQTLVGVLDMTNERAVNAFADRVVEQFGGIDVWVNSAGVYAAGRVEDVPLKDMKRVMEVNFFGYMIGARAAVTRFKEQGRGTLVDVASVNAEAPQPYGSIYGASKAAERAMDESLRMELKLDGFGNTIHVCTVLPSPVDTNIYRNSANYTRHELLAVEPVYSPESVAAHILNVVKHPRRERFVGQAGRLFALQHKFLPRLYERTTAIYTRADVLGKAPAADTPGNLYEPIETHRGVTGGWQSTRVSGETVDKALAIGAVAALAAGAIGALLLFKDKED